MSMMSWRKIIELWCLAIVILTAAVCAAENPAKQGLVPSTKTPDFDRDVAHILARRCLDWHNKAEQKGGLVLAEKAAALAGGESGPVIAPGEADDSLFWQRIDNEEMPPKKPLPKGERAILRAWIATGAAWGSDPIDPFKFTTDARAGY